MFGTRHKLLAGPDVAEAPAMPDELARLLAVWRTAMAGRAMPAKTDIHPDQIAFCLGNLALAEVERDTFRMRYRLVGKRLVTLFGRELVGRYVDEMYPGPFRREIMSHYRLVVDSRRPLFTQREFDLVVKRLGYHRLMLPLSWRRPDAAEIIMVAIYPLEAGTREASDWRNMRAVQDYLACFPEGESDEAPPARAA